MALKVEVNLPQYPEGIALGIVGVGVIENGGSIDIGESEESAFFMTNGYTIQEGTKDQEGINVTGSSEFTPPEEEVVKEEETAVTENIVQLPTGLPQATEEGDA